MGKKRKEPANAITAKTPGENFQCKHQHTALI